MTHPISLILASRSKARTALLSQAGLVFEAVPADIDERAVEREGGADPASVSAALARAKALAVSAAHPFALVIGSDQVLAFEGACLAKPESPFHARERLVELRGKAHELVTSACVAREGRVLWEVTRTARLAMAAFSDEHLDRYCALAGDDLTSTVGGYAVEGPGIGLFERIEGDYFSILGLPLLELLNFLRASGVPLLLPAEE